MHSRLELVTMACAASAMIAGYRLAARICGGKLNSTAAVAIVVAGHSEFTAIPSAFSSSAMPSVHRLMPYFEIV